MNYSQETDKLIQKGVLPDAIYSRLLGLGATPCVALELANEPKRRAAMERRRQERLERKLYISKEKGKPFRRILLTSVIPEPGSKLDKRRKRLKLPRYEFMLHATKGVRCYRLPES